jgi:hypothetical protein
MAKSLLSEKIVQGVSENIKDTSKALSALKAKQGDISIERHEFAMNLIKQYIRDHCLVVYGGCAWSLLTDNMPDDQIMYDIDVLSAMPIHDVKGISDMLYAAGFQYVNAKNSLHEETYSVFICSQKMCDVSYVPRNVMDELPRRKKEGMSVLGPKIVTIDILKLLTTPLNAYWRLERTITRARMFLEKNPIEFPYEVMERPPSLSMIWRDCAMYVAKGLMNSHESNRRILWTGETAACAIYAGTYETVGEWLEAAQADIDVPVARLELISSNFIEDAERIRALILEGGEQLESVMFQPFLNYIGHRVDFIIRGRVVVRLYKDTGLGFNYYSKSEVDQRVTTFYGTLYHLLARNLQSYIGGDDRGVRCMAAWIRAMLAARNEDDAKYAEFMVNCHGNAKTVQHDYLMRQVFKRIPTQSLITPYRPGTMASRDFDSDAYRFRNLSGNRIPKGSIRDLERPWKNLMRTEELKKIVDDKQM